jgi:hypothetical protein
MDRFKNKLLIMLLVLVGLSACVKDPQDIPEGGVIDDPAFRIEGSFDGKNVIIEAGNDNWTAFPSTISLDSSIVYTSTFSKFGCTQYCTPSWTFNFYQALPGTGNPNEDFLNTVHAGEINYVPSDEELVAYEIQVNTHDDLFYTGFSSWEDVNNPMDSFGSVFNTVVAYGDSLDMCFHSYSLYLGCQYNQCISYDPATGIPCSGYIQTNKLTDGAIMLTVKPTGTAPFIIEWMNGETTPSVVVQYEPGNVAIYADVRVTDANGNSMQITQTVIIENGVIDACYFPIEVESIISGSVSPEQLAGGMEIIYIDAEGNEWRSSAAPQPQESFVHIHDVEYFADAPNAEKAYKTSMDVRMRLTNKSTGESKLFEVEELVVPFSYRE